MTQIKPIEGKRVKVEYEGDWYKAKTLETSERQVKIQYVEDQSEEWVDPERIRSYKPEMFAIGDEVEALSEEEWLPATVKKAWYGLHLITYDDYSDWWDEWLGPYYIRARE
ncbi:MAG: hypothetical protein KME19_11540 [Microcoleus vaginatus WJT46-NPBG5]|nr:hypothetical protein [Microcoleus vaginatus WJT46-NPBG5]